MTLNQWVYSAAFLAITWALFYGISYAMKNPIHY